MDERRPDADDCMPAIGGSTIPSGTAAQAFREPARPSVGLKLGQPVNPPLRERNTADQVTRLQGILRERGFRHPVSVAEDGNAVQLLQKSGMQIPDKTAIE